MGLPPKVVITFLLLVACDGETNYNMGLVYDRHCSEAADLRTLQQWTSDCIKSANPRSDEEPEDWIEECRRSGFAIACPLVPTVEYLQNGEWIRVPCSQAAPWLQKVCPNSTPSLQLHADEPKR